MVIFTIVDTLFKVIELAIFIECIASWFPQIRYNSFMQIVQTITNPILDPCRRLQNKLNLNIPIDFSPIIAFIIIDIVRKVVFQLLFLVF